MDVDIVIRDLLYALIFGNADNVIKLVDDNKRLLDIHYFDLPDEILILLGAREKLFTGKPDLAICEALHWLAYRCTDRIDLMQRRSIITTVKTEDGWCNV